MIKVDRLTFEYPGTRALQDVSFTLPAQTITALVGPNGAGKTTLLRCLAALEQPLAGGIQIDNVDVLEQPRQCHRRVGYLSDFYGLYAQLTVRQCFQFAAAANGIADAEIAAAVARTAAQLQLHERLPQKTHTLSRGLRQRVAIGQAIIHTPRVLLLDEPASGLDPEARSSLSALFLHLRDHGMTLLVSSHILAELEEYCSQMLVIRHGKLVEHVGLDNSAAIRSVRVCLRLAAATPDWQQHLPPACVVEQYDPLAGVLRVSGGDAEAAQLLQTLLARGVPVCEFSHEAHSLQDSYLATVRAEQQAQENTPAAAT